MALGSTQPLVKMSTRNIPGGKGDRCVRLTTSPPSCAKCHEIWEPKTPGTLWATPGLLQDSWKHLVLECHVSFNVTVLYMNVIHTVLCWEYTLYLCASASIVPIVTLSTQTKQCNTTRLLLHLLAVRQCTNTAQKWQNTVYHIQH